MKHLFQKVHKIYFWVYISPKRLNNAIEDVNKNFEAASVKRVKVAQWVPNSESQTQPNSA